MKRLPQPPEPYDWDESPGPALLNEAARRLDQWRAITLVPCPVCGAEKSEQCTATTAELEACYRGHASMFKSAGGRATYPQYTHPARILLSKLIPGNASFFEYAQADTDTPAPKCRPYPKR